MAKAIKSDELYDDLYEIIRKHNLYGSINMAVLLVAMYGLLRTPSNTAAITIWLAVVLTGVAAKYIIETHFEKHRQLTRKNAIHASAFFYFIFGCSTGLGCLLFCDINGEMSSVWALFITLVFCAALMGSTSGYAPIVISYSLPAISLVAATFIVYIAQEPNVKPTEYYVFLIAFIYSLSLKFGSKALFGQFVQTHALKQQEQRNSQLLSEALKKSESANRVKTRFLASASHDLRQPIHTLSLYSATLMLKNHDDETKVITEHMNDAVGIISDQLDSLLDISKLDAGIVHPEPEAFDAMNSLKRVYRMLAASAEEKQLSLSVNGTRPMHLVSDQQLFERILNNVVSNAIRYTSQGTILVSATASETGVVVTVADTGIGISLEDTEQVFEEFYQAGNPERDRKKGLGLGLAIVKRLMDLLSGSIHLASKPGVGTTFSLSFPSLIEPNTKRAIHDKAPTTMAMAWAPRSVLVVDDEESVRSAMRSLLEKLQCNVVAASDTASALKALESFSPEIALVDFRLRGKEDGLSLINKLRQVLPDLPALIVSGDIEAEKLQLAEYKGIKILHKPVQTSELQQSISEACSH